MFLGFPCGSAGKESTCNAGDLGLIPGLGRSPGEGKGYPLEYSGLENSMDCTVHGVAKSQTRLSDFHLNSTPLQYSCLENPMDRGAWQATVHGDVRAGHDLTTKPSPLNSEYLGNRGSISNTTVYHLYCPG